MSRLANDVACVLESSFHLLMACVLPELFFLFLAGVRKWNFSVGCDCGMSVSEFFHIAIIESRTEIEMEKRWRENWVRIDNLRILFNFNIFKEFFDLFKSSTSSQTNPQDLIHKFPAYFTFTLSLNPQQKTIIYHVTHEGVKTFLFPHLTLTPRLMTTVKWDIYGTCKTGKFIL